MAKRSSKKTEQPSNQDGSEAEPKAGTWKFPALVMAIVAACIWIYWPALNGDWLWDDNRYITENPLLRNWTGLWKIWFQPGVTLDYYPLTASVQWIQWQLWGLNTQGYHITNIGLHIVNSLLVWHLLGKFKLKLAWLGGLLFAVHPVQVESVAWIAELKNTLSLAPLLGAMCLYLDYDETKAPRFYRLALVLFAFALLCKLSVVSLPLVILLHSWWKRGRLDWEDLKSAGPFFAVALVIGFITVGSGLWDRQFNHLPPSFLPAGGIVGRLVLAGMAAAFYFSKVVLPIRLLPVYPLWPVDFNSPWHYLPWLILVGAIGWFWTQRQSWGRHALLGVGFFLVNLAPCPGFIPAPNMGYAWTMDHFLYLPIIGLIGLFVATAGQLYERIPVSLHLLAIGAMIMLVALLACGSQGYACIYLDQNTLWTYALRHNPQAGSARALQAAQAMKTAFK